MNEKKSLLDVIRENIVNGELPDSFSLPKDDDGDPNKIRWADGAEEGVMIYHMGRSEISDEQMQIVADAFSNSGDTEKVVTKMKEFFEKASPIGSIDAIQRYIFDHTDILDPNVIHNLGVECLHKDDVAIVKFGLMLIEIFNEPDEELKDIIRTLGLSNEFSLFAIFNMLTWTDGNNEVFELAKKVRGWGRIHAVERLEPETEEIKEWLLAEGINNDVVPDYSALDVYQKAGIASLLKTDITDTQLDQIASVLKSMFSEGPVKGISSLSEEESRDLLGDFAAQSGNHELTANICDVIKTISEDERFKDIACMDERVKKYLEESGAVENK